jgi:TRAP-type C4-dicarboxylate transport system substrate-binding protein
MTKITTTRRGFLKAGTAAAGLLATTGLLAAPKAVRAQDQQIIKIAYNLPEHHATGTYFETLAKEIDQRTQATSLHLKPQTFPDGLPDDTKAAVHAAAMVAQKASRDQAKSNSLNEEAQLKEKGVTLTDITYEQRLVWEKAAAVLLADYRANTGDVDARILDAVAKANAAHPAK